MNFLIIQEAGRHEKNKNFRESLNLHRAFSDIDGIESKVWGLNYTDFITPFSEVEKWADIIFIVENYSFQWIPCEAIAQSKKIKVFWSIDSHCILNEHINFCIKTKIDILLNSTEAYLPSYLDHVTKSYWFPNAYPDDLILPLNIEKEHNIGFCGNLGNRADIVAFLEKYNIKKDVFVIGKDMVNAINSYKLHFNRNIADDINYRTFETTGCQTLLLTNYTPNLERLFEIDEEIVVYKDILDLEDKINFLLKNDSVRKEIEQKGYLRSKSDHTYARRARELIKILKEY